MRGNLKRIFMVLACLAIGVTVADADTIKSGDTLTISVVQDPSLNRSVLVDPAGEIAFPLAGHIRARGLTPQALERILNSRLKGNYKNQHLDITVGISGTPAPDPDLMPKIFVTGEVLRPGPYVVRQPTTLMQAIALAGGIGPYAAERRIQVRRRLPGGNETIFTFNYEAYEAGADIKGDITLRPGDVVLVPQRGLFE